MIPHARWSATNTSDSPLVSSADAFGGNLVGAAALDIVIEPEDHGCVSGNEGAQEQAQQDTAERTA